MNNSKLTRLFPIILITCFLAACSAEVELKPDISAQDALNILEESASAEDVLLEMAPSGVKDELVSYEFWQELVRFFDEVEFFHDEQLNKVDGTNPLDRDVRIMNNFEEKISEQEEWIASFDLQAITQEEIEIRGHLNHTLRNISKMNYHSLEYIERFQDSNRRLVAEYQSEAAIYMNSLTDKMEEYRLFKGQ